MLRLPLLALALALCAGACAQLAQADDAAAPGATVTIAPSDGGAARSLALADLAGSFDVHGATYTVRAADGTTSTTTVADGVSLNALLAAAGLDGDAFRYLDIARGDGSSAIVLRDELGGAGEGPPVVWSDERGVHLLRPSKGEGDANANDVVTFPDGSIAIALRTGNPLVPQIEVSTLRARVGQRVDFSASLAAGRLDPGMEFEWYFDGTGTKSGAHVSHRFVRRGTYLVLLNVVRGSGNWVGATDRERVHVVASRHERRSDDARGSGDSRDDTERGAGGGGEGGTGTGGAGTGGAGTGAGAGTGGTFAAPPTPPASSPSAASGVAPTPAPAPRRAREPRRTPPGELVSGTLIAAASATAAPVDARPAASAAARGAASEGPLDVPVGVWVAIGLVVLLALGWALESRHTVPFWQP